MFEKTLNIAEIKKLKTSMRLFKPNYIIYIIP